MVSYLASKAAGCKTVTHFHAAEVKNVSNYNATPPYIFRVWQLITQMIQWKQNLCYVAKAYIMQNSVLQFLAQTTSTIMFLVTRTQHMFSTQFYFTLSHSTKAYSPEHTKKLKNLKNLN